jgi:hypothetical protein
MIATIRHPIKSQLQEKAILSKFALNIKLT